MDWFKKDFGLHFGGDQDKQYRTFARINISIRHEVLNALDEFIDYKIQQAQNREEIKKLTRSGVISSAVLEYIKNHT